MASGRMTTWAESPARPALSCARATDPTKSERNERATQNVFMLLSFEAAEVHVGRVGWDKLAQRAPAHPIALSHVTHPIRDHPNPASGRCRPNRCRIRLHERADEMRTMAS